MNWVKFTFSLAITLLLFYFLHFPQDTSPPLGKFLNPFAGFWQNNTRDDNIMTDRDLIELRDSVTVLWDDRRVPHIFAKNNYDLYFMQGYLTAKDRLWQMEFLTHAAAGRVSEIVGKAALDYDRFRRRIGMVYAAENTLESILSDDQSRLAINAYADGVNAWIERLIPEKLPIEYKILDYRPEQWTPIKSVLLLKYMAWKLSGYSEEKLRTRTLEALGDSLTKELFFSQSLMLKPVIPEGTEWDFQPIDTPEPPPQYFKDAGSLMNLPAQYTHPQNGSNNWAVSGKKTDSGLPILCNDPHLDLKLPSIWYEAQLVAPNINVYGVSLPGAPSIIIGFNQDIAWGVTNAETDVLDWYRIEFKSNDAKQYRYDGDWHSATQRIEKIKVRGQETVTDTIPITHHGLVVYRRDEKSFNKEVPTGMALRWVAHDPSNELAAFLKINQARAHQDFMDGLSYYNSPAQNFIFADANNNIAIHHNGKFPLRWKFQGRFISEGSNPQFDWKRWIPRNHLPQIKNPERGFLYSANQPPTDETYPYYLAGNYDTFERSTRIHQRLSQMEEITPKDMMTLQTDLMNMRARTVLPVMLENLPAWDLSVAEYHDYDILQNWNYMNSRESIGATLFETWWNFTTNLIWEDDLKQNGTKLLWPNADVTVKMLLHDSVNMFYDISDTEIREFREDILRSAFQQTHQELTKKFGPHGENWEWGEARKTHIPHLANIKGFGRGNLKTDGNRDIINAITSDHGPTWRMIVQLGRKVKAWGIYPGGQSGNPGSRFYDNAVDDWVRGQYYQLLYLQSPRESHPRLKGTTVFGTGQ